MPLSRRSLLATLAAAPFASLASRTAFAAYPDRPIRLIVPFAPGGNADLVGRLLSETMAPSLGQSLVVENRAGAGGSLGAGVVAAAAPDGYTLLIGSNGPLTVNPFMQAKLSYDPLKDFVAVGLANLAPHAIVLNPGVAAKTVAELVALSKKEPITIATSGTGSAGHMTLVRFMTATGATLTHVPYKGGSTPVPDTLSGVVNGIMTEMSTALPHHKAGKLRILAVASSARSPQVPEVPTMIEAGLKDFLAASYVGLLAPAKTPADALALLEKALVKALAAKPLQDRFLATGAELVPEPLQTSKGFGDYIRKEFESTREAAKAAGLKPE
jgi:tripartite-type tricarboxylate transporter receptor subunit TctC